MNWKQTIALSCFFLIVLSGLSCKKQSEQAPASLKVDSDFPYTLKKETRKIILPDELEEISGIAYIDAEKMSAVQDEEGRVYIISLKNGKILQKEVFAKDGDFEDITIIDEQIAWAVRSDGKLYQITDYLGKDPKAKKIETALSSKNDVEGLCYDKKNNRLLLALKAQADIKSDLKGEKKTIFAFDLTNNQLSAKPILTIDIDAIEERAGKNLSFAPSGIAIHPFTHEFYVISSVGKLMVILDQNGAFVKAKKLSSNKDFKQPEGICFAPDGTLYISNEGAGGKGNILQFDYHKHIE